jgi:hypothetical protein
MWTQVFNRFETSSLHHCRQKALSLSFVDTSFASTATSVPKGDVLWVETYVAPAEWRQSKIFLVDCYVYSGPWAIQNRVPQVHNDGTTGSELRRSRLGLTK